MTTSQRVLNDATFWCVLAASIVLINLAGWFLDQYQDILLFTLLGVCSIPFARQLFYGRGRIEQKRHSRLMLDLSHSLQMPLAIFQTKLEQLKQKLPHAQEVCVLEEPLHELSSFVEDMLKLNRLEGRAAYVLARLHFSAFVSELAEGVRTVSEANRIQLAAAIAPNLYIRGDSTRLQEALSTILHNSIKYMRQDGGRIITMSLAEKNAQAVLCINDTGKGIAAEDIPHIFKRFWRGRNASMIPGNGLGLAIAKTILEKHGGSIDVSSELNKGTDVCIRLPLAV